MLCAQSRQGCTQGFYSVVVALSITCVLLASCFEGNRELTEADLSAFGTFVDSLDTSVEGKWFTRMGMSSDADSLLAYLLREVPANGLDVTAFGLSQIADDLDIVHRLSFDSVGVSINEVLPRLDSLLSKAYISYTTGQRYGFVRPSRLFNRMDYKANSSEFAKLFDYDIQSPDSKQAEQELLTDHRLAYLYESQPQDHVYLLLKSRLEKTTDKEARRRLAINMERCRWQIQRPSEVGRQIVVNIPSQQLWAICPDSVLNMRICCGAVTNKTPLLNSAISYMQVNPEWIIPHNIIKTDVAHHGGDSAYFARNRYYITDRTTGDTISPTTVTSDELLSGRLRVGQRGGIGNSLGRIVFRFPNNFSIYLHDTNNRGAFNREHRTLSHGCVRVQKPFELALFLVPEMDDWKVDCLRISMDIRPMTERGQRYVRDHSDDPRPFRLMTYHDISPHVPVYIIYYTVYPNPETGVVETWPDLYGYDKVISQQMDLFLPK